MMILVIDNYDSFVHNISRYLERSGAQVRVVRNDAISIEEISALAPDALLISPGPRRPKDAGVSMPALQHFAGMLPILGVCLGHQCIGEFYGGNIGQARHPLHGQASSIRHDGNGLFTDLPTPLTAGRYHSLVVKETPKLLGNLTIAAWSKEKEIMALIHRSDPTYGIQFHPESVLTDTGEALLNNFLSIVRDWHARRGEAVNSCTG
jgi:para-aminobenzoate synthetase component 2